MNSKLAEELFRPVSGKPGSPLDNLRASIGRQLQPWTTSGEMGVGDTWWTMASGSPFAATNMSLIYGGSDDSLDSALEVVSRREVPSIAVLSGAGLAQAGRLLDRGFAFVGANPIMAIALDPTQTKSALSDGLEVRRVYVKKDTDMIVTLLQESFELPFEVCTFFVSPEIALSPEVYFWLLFDQGQPVCTVTTTAEEGILGIKSMATPPSAQRKGYGKALLSQVLLEHAQQGERIGLLSATLAGEPLYRRLGFEVVEFGQVFAGMASGSQ
jgi:GNAT superfamily N-acetyltransferase